MSVNMRAFWIALVVGMAGDLSADTFTPEQLAAPFGVQPFAGLPVNGGVTDPFFSDLSGLAFPGPAILDVLADVQAFDSNGDPIDPGSFTVTGVTVTQGSSFSPALGTFSVLSPVTYSSTLNPLNQVTVNPGEVNLAFAFNSDATFQYAFTLAVSGIPDGGFVLYDDVEGALIPEPALGWPLAVAMAMAGIAGYFQQRKRSTGTS